MADPIAGRGVDVGVDTPLPAIAVVKIAVDRVYVGIFPLERPPIVAQFLRPKMVCIDASLVAHLLGYDTTTTSNRRVREALIGCVFKPFYVAVDKSK